MQMFEIIPPILAVVFFLNIEMCGSIRRRVNESGRKKFYYNKMRHYEKYLIRVSLLKFLTTHKAERYSPNMGYEPYWQGGDWVFDELITTTPGEITTSVVLVCGVECNEIYRGVGEICAVKAGFIPDADLKYQCRYDGTCAEPRPFTPVEYFTVPTFCAFLKIQCNGSTTLQGTTSFVHVGRCQVGEPYDEDKQPFNNLYRPENMLKRLTKWVTGLSSRLASYNISTLYPAWHTTKLVWSPAG